MSESDIYNHPGQIQTSKVAPRTERVNHVQWIIRTNYIYLRTFNTT